MASPEVGRASLPPSGGSVEDELGYYKSQYEQLELELQDFQASSRELETELEKDIEASEKRERQLKEKVERLGFEVEEWKTKYRQAKAEANNAQNALQKEVTSLRDSNRTMQLKLRDIEVANDDFERQARNTTSSLEDLESKYNVAIERGVLLEEEIKVGEQEREKLRIETQRLRDELSDLKVENEIVQGRLRLAESTAADDRQFYKTRLQKGGIQRERSPASETSASVTTRSSPTPSTPPPGKSETSTMSDAPTPPSPPSSDTSALSKTNPLAKQATPRTAIKRHISTIGQDGPSLLSASTSSSSTVTNSTVTPTVTASTATAAIPGTPRPYQYSSSRSFRHSRGPSIPVSGAMAAPPPPNPILPRRAGTGTGASGSSRPSIGHTQSDLPRSGSLYQIRGLIGKMQKLEARVHNARAKLPAPVGSPSSGRAPGTPVPSRSSTESQIPSTVTLRSARKRISSSVQSSSVGTDIPTTPTGPPRSITGAGCNIYNNTVYERPGSSSSSISRPSSRTSFSSRYGLAGAGPGAATAMATGIATGTGTGTGPVPGYRTRPTSRQSFGARPSSRQSFGGAGSRVVGADTANGAPTATTTNQPYSVSSGLNGSSRGREIDRPASAMSGYPAASQEQPQLSHLATPRRRGVVEKASLSSIPTASGLAKRQSGGKILTNDGLLAGGRRSGTGFGEPRLPGGGSRYALPAQRSPTHPLSPTPTGMSGVPTSTLAMAASSSSTMGPPERRRRDDEADDETY